MERGKNINYSINAEIPLPINIQVKEQIKWLIGSGTLKQGDELPSTNELATRLNVNRNTINGIYKELRDEGWLLMIKGKGTSVAQSVEIEQKSGMYQFLARKLQEANENTVILNDLPIAIFLYAQLIGIDNLKMKKLLFIEFRKNEFEVYEEEINQLLKGDVKITSYDEICALGKKLPTFISDIDIIITPSSKLIETKALIDPYRKRILTVGEIPF